MSSQGGLYQPGNNIDDTLIYKALVVSVPDTATGYEPIKCRIPVTDSKAILADNNDLSDCYPLLPKHLNVYPKVNEYVYILTLGSSKNQQLRYFLGPVIDTYKNLTFNDTDTSETNASIKSNLKEKPESGIYPKREWISIQGRNNADLVFRSAKTNENEPAPTSEVLIRAGKYKFNEPLIFNNQDTGYIQIRYGSPELKETNESKTITDVKLFQPEGFAVASLTNVIGVFDWIVNIRIEDKNNIFIGRIYQTFTSEDKAVAFIKETFIDLKKNDANTISEIRNNQGLKIDNIYDFSKFKYENKSIPQLKNFDINRPTEPVTRTETVKVTKTVFDNSKGSSINVVATKINLISYGNKSNFKLLDPDTNITAEQQLKINTEGQPIPYGYILNNFLNLMKLFMLNHVHAYHGLPADPDIVYNQVKDFDLETILNQNVRTA